MLAVIAGLLDLIPQVGATIAAIILVAVALTVSTEAAVIMLVIQLIYQQVENYIVYPIVYRQAVELSPFTTIVAVLIAGSILGVVGAILALPFAAVIKIVLREAGRPRRERMASALSRPRVRGRDHPAGVIPSHPAGAGCSPPWPTPCTMTSRAAEAGARAGAGQARSPRSVPQAPARRRPGAPARARLRAGRAVAGRLLRARDRPRHRPLRGDDGADRREPRRPAGGRPTSSTTRSRAGSTSTSLMREALPARRTRSRPRWPPRSQQAIRARLDAFVASENFQRLWVEANRRAHARDRGAAHHRAVRRLLLEGDTVYLDLGAVVDRVRQGLQDAGLDRLAAAIPASVDGRVTLLQVRGLRQGARGRRPDRAADDRAADPRAAVPRRARVPVAPAAARAAARRARPDRHLADPDRGAPGSGARRTSTRSTSNVLPRQAAADIFDALIGLLRTGVRVIVVVAVLVALLALVLGRTDRLAGARCAGARRSAWVAGTAAAAGRGGGARRHRALLLGSADGAGVC